MANLGTRYWRRLGNPARNANGADIDGPRTGAMLVRVDGPARVLG